MAALTSVACGYLVLNTAPILVGVFMSVGFSETSAASLVTCEWLATAVTSFGLSLRLQAPSLYRVGLTGIIVAAAAQLATLVALRSAGAASALILIVRVVAGVGEGLLLYAANSAISLLRDPARPYALAMIVGSVSSASVLLLTPALQTRLPFAVFALLALGLLLASVFIGGLPASLVRQGAGAPRIRRDPAVYLSLTAVLAANVALGALWAFSEVAGTRLGISPAVADQIIALNLAAGLGGGLVAAWLNSRLDYRVSLVAGTSFLVVVAIALCTVTALWMYVVAQLCYGALYPIVITFLMAAVAKLDCSGNLLPAAGGVTLVGLSLGPAAGGLLVTSSSMAALGLGVGLLLAVSVTAMLLAFSKIPASRVQPDLGPPEGW
jgi:MFS transporter, DHA1 family, inner membrane transport protein